MPTSFTYLDDEPPPAVRPYVRAVMSSVEGLQIEHIPPKAYPEQIAELRDRHRDGKLDGLILDLRLDQFTDWEGGTTKANYRAATLAQEIRTRATEGNLPEFPIVLWSTDERLRRSYVNDDTSHDLFDIKSVKASLEQPEGAHQVGIQLLSLVSGYRTLQSAKAKYRGRNRAIRLLGFTEAPEFLDGRILLQLEGRERTPPAHESARFVLRQMLDTPGPLIDAKLLAARLGIDLSSSPGFQQLVEKQFSSAAYNGVFYRGWPRWWTSEIERLWRSSKGVQGSLRVLSAQQRVEHLSKAFKAKDITPAAPPTHSQSVRFWTACQATGLPLDPKEGYLVDRQPLYPWQDRLYVSLISLLDGTAKAQGIRIDPIENGRFIRARKSLS